MRKARWSFVVYSLVALITGCNAPSSSTTSALSTAAAPGHVQSTEQSLALADSGAFDAPSVPSQLPGAPRTVSPDSNPASQPTAPTPRSVLAATDEKYPAEPCLEHVDVGSAYLACFGEMVEAVHEDLEATVSAERSRKDAANRATAALLSGEAKWEAKRDSDCNQRDKEFPGGSAGELAIGICRYQADRRRLAQYRAAASASVRSTGKLGDAAMGDGVRP